MKHSVETVYYYYYYTSLDTVYVHYYAVFSIASAQVVHSKALHRI